MTLALNFVAVEQWKSKPELRILSSLRKWKTTYSEKEEIIRATRVNALHPIKTISIVHLFEAETKNVVNGFPKILRFLLEALEKKEGSVKIAGSIAKESLNK